MGVIMGVDIRSLGLLLLGAGVFILSLLALHFYLTKVLPFSGVERSFSTFCEDLNGVYAIRIENFGTQPLSDVNVFIKCKLACHFDEINPGGSDVCLYEGNNETVVYKVRAFVGKKKVEVGDVCHRVLVRPVR